MYYHSIQVDYFIVSYCITADSQSPCKMVNFLLKYIDNFIAYLNIMLVTSHLAVRVVEVIMINTLTYFNNI